MSSGGTTHVPLEDLAAFAAGDLAGAQAAAVMRHAGRCPACQADLTALQRTTSALADVPEAPLPLRVAMALTDALNRERGIAPVRTMPAPAAPAAQAQPAPAAAPPTQPAPMHPGQAPAPMTPPPPAAHPGFVARPHDVPEIMELSAGADMVSMRRRKSRAPKLLAAAALLAVTAAGAFFVADAVRQEDKPAVVAVKKYESAALYSQQTTKTNVLSLLKGQLPPASTAEADAVTAEAPAAGTAPGFDSSPPAADTKAVSIERLKDAAALRNCIDKLGAKAGVQPILVDFGTFQGERSGPALIVVLPFELDDKQVDVYIVGPGCGLGSEDLYFFERVPRG